MSSADTVPRLGQEPDYPYAIKRIISVLRADDVLSNMVANWEEGDLPEKYRAVALPSVRAVLAPRPQSVRQSIGPAVSPSDLPSQWIGTDYHIIIVAGGATALEAQTSSYNIERRIRQVLGANVQLRDSEGEDPICGTLELNSVSRLVSQTGTTLDSITVIVRTHAYRVGPTVPPAPA